MGLRGRVLNTGIMPRSTASENQSTLPTRRRNYGLKVKIVSIVEGKGIKMVDQIRAK
jgi:hypothetical protein